MVNAFGGEWTRQKLQIIEDYLKAYTTGLKNQSFHICYVDAFAGAGYVNVDSGGDTQAKLLSSEDGWDSETANVLKGSARRAIEVHDKPFDEFIFVELNFEYATELSKLKYEFGDRNIHVVSDDANKFLPAWCSERISDWGHLGEGKELWFSLTLLLPRLTGKRSGGFPKLSR